MLTSPKLQALAGYDYPVRGKANLTLQARAPARSLTPKATSRSSTRSSTANLYSSSNRICADGNEASLNNMHVAYYDAQASGGAAYDLSTHTYHFNLTGKNFDLTHIPRLQTTRVSRGRPC